jgi:hypothetical protein
MLMAESRANGHVWVLYTSSDRADEILRETCRHASRVTVVVLARWLLRHAVDPLEPHLP